ncbi:major facilitator superfamily protein [Hirsutella rhossiliensis]|uniref:Major facilitator superfamily domain-containing protein n=1 Tax=Hirsutella rhossiliensis TaxID=111463 RepID=A0A9P8SDN8_9HYPO|nr:major facilitator superfamily domain-containing protein [Hirsutella rhossiliensis]KAH0958159.1 major facilitator superfamily domain-containing protein [Hirsutella rhossiliensis]
MASQTQPRGVGWRSKPSFVIVTVAFGLFTDLVLYGIVVPVLPFLLRDRFLVPDEQLQPYTSGLLAVYSASSVLFPLPAGWSASRVGSRRLFLAGLALLCASSAAFAFAGSFTILLSSRLLQGMSTAIVWTAGLDMVQDTVPPGQIGEAIGTIFATISAGELVAPMAGGVIYEWAGTHGIFGISAALLVVDFAMRLLVVDSKTAIKYGAGDANDANDANHDGDDGDDGDQDQERYKIRGDVVGIFKTLPILHCFREPRLHVAMTLSLVQALLIGALDATVPIEAESLFGFSSLQVGLIFTALMTPYLALGRLAGQAVDRYGTRTVTTLGYLYLAPCLVLLGLPGQHVVSGKYNNISLFCLALAMNGVGLAAVSSPAFVEAIDIVGKYESANPELFGVNGPYAQLFGFNSMYFFAGLGIGPILAGALRSQFGFLNMGVAFAAMSAMTSVASFFMVGPRRGDCH